MTTIVTRAGKGSPLTHTEVDTNFTNLNTAKLETAAIPLGTLAAPSISFTGDANTGVYSPGADTLAFVTAGSNRLHITSGGLVGLGISSPGDILHVKGGSTYASVIADNSAATGGGAFRAYRNGVQKAIFCADSWVTGTSSDDAAIYADAGGGIKFYTNNSATAKAVLTSAGLLGIGTTSNRDSTKLDVLGDITFGANASYYGTLGYNAGTGHVEYTSSDGAFKWIRRTGSATSMVLDSSGRLLVGTSSARSNLYAGGLTAALQVEGTTYNTSSLSMIANGSSSALNPYPIFYLGRSRGVSVGSNTIVASGDNIGSIIFTGADGTNLIPTAAIECFVDGTPGVNDLPGRLVFSTTPDGSASPTERMTIKSNGIINFSNAPTHADNTAATAAGLAVGDVYKTVLGVLMIRF